MLIAVGVFLGLAGEQWRENARHREMAEAALRRFRSEIVTNRTAVANVKDYHVTMKKKLAAYFAADAKTRPTVQVQLQGVRPAFFEHTAWDLALATQSLAYIDPTLAFGLSRIYTSQQDYAELSRGVLQAMYLAEPDQERRSVLRRRGGLLRRRRLDGAEAADAIRRHPSADRSVLGE